MKKLILLLFTATAFSVTMQAQVVSLFAGSPYVGENAYSGATGAINKFNDSFSIPWGIAHDTSGRYWITDQHNVSMISGASNYVKGGFTGDPLSGAGYDNSTGTNSRFANPSGCAIHPKTNRVFVCDADNNVIRYATNSVPVSNTLVEWGTFAGVQDFIGGFKDGAVGIAEFMSPQDMVFSSSGSIIYVCDRDNHCIRKITGGQVTTIAGSGGNSGDVDATGTSARFYAPTGLYLVDDNTLLVADRNNAKIRKIDLTNNKVTTVVDNLNMPTDMVQVNGVIYIADSYCIRKWDGTTLSTYAGKYNVSGYTNGSDQNARFSVITLIDYNPKTQSIYVTDMGNNVFRQLTVVLPPTADFTANKTAVTVNETVIITSTSINSKSYVWAISPSSYSLLNGSQLTDSVIYVSFANTGSYTVELTATNPTGSNKKTKNNYINVSVIGSNKPVPDFYADITTADVGQTVSFIDQTTDNPTSWAWAFTPNTVTYQGGTNSTTRFPKVSFNATGTYTVELTSSNTNGSNTKTKTNYITVNTASVKGQKTEALLLYPNPAADVLYIGADASRIQLTSVSGQVVQFDVQNGVASVANLSAGVYHVSCIDRDGIKYTGRFVKLAN